MEIIPAILPKDFSEIEEKTELIRGLSEMVQVDICDGKFVPSTTWPYKKRDERFEAIQREEEGMPNWEEIDYEFDLMIDKPTEEDMQKWLIAGATRVVLHAESSDDLIPAMNALKGLTEIGLGLNVKTPPDQIEKYKEYISYVQLMGIDKIGFQGQPFDEKVLAKVKKVKEKYPDLIIQIDGAVNEESAGLLAEAGAGRLIVGSALFEADNIVEMYHDLEQA